MNTETTITNANESENTTASISFEGARLPLDTSCDTVLDALRTAGVQIDAPCGGGGTCKKCTVLVRDAEGLRSVLACATKPREDMTVLVEPVRPFSIAEKGIDHPFAPTADATGYGLAIDVGTTTVVERLYELASGTCLATVSQPNPQIVYGADVIARISACSEGALKPQTALIVRALDEMASALCAQAGITRDDITKAVLAGNTVMESIAAGISPEPIGVNPFIPLSYFGNEVELPQLAPRTHFVACLSGYVGGDITAGILACDIARAAHPQLLLDLGTNGEMALGCRERLLTCATAAGPVFEGANITFGMPARSGAISQVSLGQDGLIIHTIDDAAPFGICGTGIIDAVAVLLDAGIIDETGHMLDADEARDALDDRAFAPSVLDALIERLEEDERSVRFRLAPGIYLTQADVRNVQLAKAAICAGIHTLLGEYGCTVNDIETLSIAGGFGKFLNTHSAARIGLFPPELIDRVRSIGNAAIEGASALLVSQLAHEVAQDIKQSSEYVELSTSMAFNMHYVECMGFE